MQTSVLWTILTAMPTNPKEPEDKANIAAFKANWNPIKTDPRDYVGVNLRLPTLIHRQLRIKSVMLGMTLNEAIAAAVEEWTKQ